MTRVATCPYCAETIEAGRLRCPHCGEALVDRSDLAAWLADVEPDPAFAAQVREWPDDGLLRALRDLTDAHEPPRQRALLDEVRRRGLPVPRRGVPIGPSPLAPVRAVWENPTIVGWTVLLSLLILIVVLFA